MTRDIEAVAARLSTAIMSLIYDICRLVLRLEAKPSSAATAVADTAVARHIDILKHLSTVHRSQFDIRQKLEWRVIFTALTFYVLIPVGVNSNKIRLPTGWSWIFTMYAFFTALIYFFLWRLQKAHVTNKLAAESAEDILWDLVGKDPAKLFDRSIAPENRQSYVWLRARSFLIPQYLMLLFFAAISFATITFWAGPIDGKAVENKSTTIQSSPSTE